MKLTKTDREAFIRAVMGDVPETDYDELAREALYAAAAELLPAPVRALWDDPKLRSYVRCDHRTMTPGVLSSFSCPAYVEPVRGSKLDMHLRDLADKKREQLLARGTLREKLMGAISACSTRKQALERMPEFEKYLPAERDPAGTAGVPALANLVADLTKAGWPKK
jgi:hypothetical protein